MRRLGLFLIAFYASLVAQEALPSEQQRMVNPLPPKSILMDGVPAETNSTSTAQWNMMDWKKHIENESNVSVPLNRSLPTNTQAIFKDDTKKNTALKGNLNELTTQFIKSNPAFANDKSIQEGFDDVLKNSLVEKSISNPFVNIVETPDTVQCYIARDISFRWECPIDNMIYGGDMQSDGRKARLNCENNCYEQRSCVDVGTAASTSNVDYTNLTCNFGATPSGCTHTYSVSSTGQDVESIVIALNASSTKKYKLNISIVDSKNVIKTLISSTLVTLLDDNVTLPLNESIKTISISLFPLLGTTETATVDKVSLGTKNKEKWICPTLQDIGNFVDNNLSFKCSTSQIVNLVGTNGSSYSICNDGTYATGTTDGTFSSQTACADTCKLGAKCMPNTTTMTTSTLQHSFREGCIEGQANCNNANFTCKQSRISGEVIVTETVFDASSTPVKTVINSVPIEGVKRPKVSNAQSGGESEEQYQLIHQEEWKDGAFKDMVDEAKYAVSQTKIGENTKATSGYRKGIVAK